MKKALLLCPECGSLNRVELGREGVPKCGRCKVPMRVQGATVDVTLDQLRSLIQSSPVPVVVDFWAPWCGPCLSFAPTYASTAERHAGEFVFAKLNTQDHQAAGAAFGVRGIPTIAVFSGGSEVARQSGAMDPRTFEGFLASHTG